MDEIIFYQPPLASKSQHLPSLNIYASDTSAKSFASHSGRQTISQLSQRNDLAKDQATKNQAPDNQYQKSHSSDQRCGTDTIQYQDTMTQNSPNSDDQNDLPDIDEILSSILQKNNTTDADPDSKDDDSFVDTDQFLSGTRQKSKPADTNQIFGSIVEKGNNRNRDSSLAYSGRSEVGSSRDLVILSDNESGGAESETDYSILNSASTTRQDCLTDVAAGRLADGDESGSGTTLVIAHQDDEGDTSGAVNSVGSQLAADCYLKSNSAREMGDKDINNFAEGNDNIDNTRVTRQSILSSFACNDTASDNSILQSQDRKHGPAQSQQLGPAVVSLQQPDLMKNLPSQYYRSAHTTTNVRPKRSRGTASNELASTVSAALLSTDFEGFEPRARVTAPGLEYGICDADQVMVDVENVEDSNDEDYRDMRGAARSGTGSSRWPRKRARRAKNAGDTGLDAGLACPEVASIATAANPTGDMQESEQIPVYGYLTLKTVKSEVVYCLSFTQGLLPHSQNLGQRQDSPVEFGAPPSVAPVIDADHAWEIRKIIDREVFNGEKYYKVRWEDTWMPEIELAGADKLINEFEARFRHGKDGPVEGRQKRLYREQSFISQSSAIRGERVTKKPRGRPRKQK